MIVYYHLAGNNFSTNFKSILVDCEERLGIKLTFEMTTTGTHIVSCEFRPAIGELQLAYSKYSKKPT